MNGEHKVNLKGNNVYWDPNDARDAGWAVTMVLAAYDHELFETWDPARPNELEAWKNTLHELLHARAAILAEVTTRRLAEYRATGVLVASNQLN